MSKQKTYRILIGTLWTMICVGMLFLGMVAMKKKQQQKCKQVVVQISNTKGKVFLDEAEIETIMAQEAGAALKGMPLENINLRNLENKLIHQVWINSADLFFDNRGILYAHIAERVPVVRVFDKSGRSFYLDSAAMKLPLSITDRANVPVFTNMPQAASDTAEWYRNLKHDVVKMGQAVSEDPFWLAQAGQIDIGPSANFTIYPAIGNHIVSVGKATNLSQKLSRVKQFYTDLLSRQNFNRYSELNVAFENQLIAVRREGGGVQVDTAKAVQVFKDLVEKNKTAVNAAAVESEKPQGRIVLELPVSAPANKKKVVVAPAAQSPQVTPDSVKVPKAIMPKQNTNNN